MCVDDIIAAKRSALEKRKAKTPIEAIRALASMQKRPLPFLNTVMDDSEATLIGLIRHDATPYDPVGLAVRYLRAGMDSVALFTDDRVYDGGLSDLALVTRAVRSPVMTQDYILDEYQIVEARAAGASSLVLYADILDTGMLRTLVSATQRNRMTAIVQVNDARQLAFAQFLSPQAIALGDQRVPFSAAPMDTLWRLRMSIPRSTRVMIGYVLETLDDVEAVAPLCPDAVLLGETLLANDDLTATIRRTLAAVVRPG